MPVAAAGPTTTTRLRRRVRSCAAPTRCKKRAGRINLKPTYHGEKNAYRTNPRTSILALSLNTGASAQKIDWNIFAEPFISPAHAQDIDWQKVDDVLGRKPAVVGRRASLWLSTLRSFGDAGRRDDQAGAGARRLGRVQADARRRHGHGRSCPAGHRDQPGHGQDDRQRPRDHGGPQPSAARHPRDLLHAHRRPRRSRQTRDRDP